MRSYYSTGRVINNVSINWLHCSSCLLQLHTITILFDWICNMFAAVCSKVCDTEPINVSESCLFMLGSVINHHGIYITLRLLASDTFFSAAQDCTCMLSLLHISQWLPYHTFSSYETKLHVGIYRFWYRSWSFRISDNQKALGWQHWLTFKC